MAVEGEGGIHLETPSGARVALRSPGPPVAVEVRGRAKKGEALSLTFPHGRLDIALQTKPLFSGLVPEWELPPRLRRGAVHKLERRHPLRKAHWVTRLEGRLDASAADLRGVMRDIAGVLGSNVEASDEGRPVGDDVRLRVAYRRVGTATLRGRAFGVLALEPDTAPEDDESSGIAIYVLHADGDGPGFVTAVGRGDPWLELHAWLEASFVGDRRTPRSDPCMKTDAPFLESLVELPALGGAPLRDVAWLGDDVVRVKWFAPRPEREGLYRWELWRWSGRSGRRSVLAHGPGASLDDPGYMSGDDPVAWLADPTGSVVALPVELVPAADFADGRYDDLLAPVRGRKPGIGVFLIDLREGTVRLAAWSGKPFGSLSGRVSWTKGGELVVHARSGGASAARAGGGVVARLRLKGGDRPKRVAWRSPDGRFEILGPKPRRSKEGYRLVPAPEALRVREGGRERRFLAPWKEDRDMIATSLADGPQWVGPHHVLLHDLLSQSPPKNLVLDVEVSSWQPLLPRELEPDHDVFGFALRSAGGSVLLWKSWGHWFLGKRSVSR